MATRGKRRALGQHFLRDRAIAGRIAEAAVSEAVAHGCHALLEIGPGRGAITEPILALLAEHSSITRFTLSEADRALAAHWKDRFSAGAPGIEVRVEEGDFLDLPEERWLPDRGPLAIASNLPYSSGTTITIRLARLPRRIGVMVLMFQAEVAQRLRAEPGTKDWGSLSLWIQNRWDVRKLLSVPPGAFSPPPRVQSEIVVLTPRAEARVPVEEDASSENLWETLLRVSFAHRRKMLRSGLPASGPWRNALDAAHIDDTRRAESLGWDEWRCFFEALRSSSRS